MPYASSAAKTWDGIVDGRRVIIYTVTETGVTGAANEWSLALRDLPPVGTITQIQVTPTKGAGAGTTIQPVIGSATGKSDIYSAAGTTAITSVAVDTTNWRYVPALRTLYGKSACDSTCDTIVTRLTITAGHV